MIRCLLLKHMICLFWSHSPRSVKTSIITRKEKKKKTVFQHIVCYFDFSKDVSYFTWWICSQQNIILHLYCYFSFPFLLFSFNHLKTLTGGVQKWGETVISFYKWICDYLSTSYVYLGKDLRTGETFKCFSIDKLEDIRNAFIPFLC